MTRRDGIRCFKSFQEAYVTTAKMLYKHGKAAHPRGQLVKELYNYQFIVDDPRQRLLDVKGREHIYRYMFGELMWYLSGRDDVAFIDRYSKMWANISDDGVHSNSAYGKYIFKPMPVKGDGVKYTSTDYMASSIKSQWDWCTEQLIKDPYTRQAIIHIKPIQMYDTKDVTCTIALMFFIRKGELNMQAIMRSNDLIYGLTFDGFMFMFLQEMMLLNLISKGVDVRLGKYYHFAANMHYYEKDIKKVEAIIASNPDEYIEFPSLPVQFIQGQEWKYLILKQEQWWNSNEEERADVSWQVYGSNISVYSKYLWKMFVDNELPDNKTLI